MRLIDATTFEFTWFPGEVEPYAILSHTWGSNEVKFSDFSDLSAVKATPAFQKIEFTCRQARLDGLKYVWIDTCCIDKESSAELTEAINSMFRWYRDAAICYAYIEDLPEGVQLPVTNVSPDQVFKDCRWFSRGWTLQELLAPTDIVFYGPQWKTIGRKTDLVGILQRVTGIPGKVLSRETRLDEISVADRMNWAANRQTTRQEDIAYCLMGIFDVNMPMMYGEGRKAFLRLQEEIARQTQDDSLFAWRASSLSASSAAYRGLFASSPKEFANEESIKPFRVSGASPTTILGDGRVSLSCVHYKDGVLGLKCSRATDSSSVIGIQVANAGQNYFLRSSPSILVPKSHIPASFEVAVFDKFTERGEPGIIEDIYSRASLCLSKVPPGVRLKRVFPEEYARFWAKDNRPLVSVPLVYMLDKEIAFELAIDSKTTGVSILRNNRRGEREPLLPQQEDIRVFLVAWAEETQGSNSYNCHLRLDRVGHDKTNQRAVGQQAVRCGWSTLDVEVALTPEDGRQVFNVTLSLRESTRSREDALREQELRERPSMILMKVGKYVGLPLLYIGFPLLFWYSGSHTGEFWKGLFAFSFLGCWCLFHALIPLIDHFRSQT